MFEDFKRELSAHAYGGYHRCLGRLDRETVLQWFSLRSISPPPNYIDFLCQVGPGAYFAGSLVIYPLSNTRHKSVESELARFAATGAQGIFPFGDEGTTESSLFLAPHPENDAVYRFSWEEKAVKQSPERFHEWIELKPTQLFNDKVYAGYKRLTNVEEMVAVMEERAAFSVRLVGYEKQLQKLPERPNDVLRRYTKVTIEVIKTRPADIEFLTVGIERLGSRIGSTNMEYTSIPVSDVPLNNPCQRECYVFDPFNLPFTGIQIRFNPIVDLGSPSRVRFKELSALLT